MLNFAEFLGESKKTRKTMNDLLGGVKDSETERHRKQYYDDSHPDSSFNKIGGRYVLDRDRTDLHPDFKRDAEIKLDRISKEIGSDGKVRYHGIVGNHAIPMSHFQKPKTLMKRSSDPTRLENEQISSIKSQIEDAMKENGGKPIQLKTADGKVHNVTGIKAVKGNKKADAYLHDEHGNPLHYMSLKGDTYQQWGGYSDVFEHPKIKKIIEKMKELKGKLAPNDASLPSGSVFHHTLDRNDPEDKKIIMKAMYGKDHGKDHGENNVHAIYGGNTVALKKDKQGIYNLFTNALHVNRNDDTSDITDAKVMLHKSGGHSQQGTGGRITIQHASNVPSSLDITNGTDEAIQKFKAKKHPKPRSVHVDTRNIETPQKQEVAIHKPAPQHPNSQTVGGLPWKTQ